MQDSELERGARRPFSGIIWAYRFDAAGHARKVGLDEPVAPFDEGDGFLWLHLDLIDRLTRDWVEKRSGLPQSARQALLGSDDHPQLESDDALVWGVFIDNMEDPEDEDTLRAAPLRFVLGDRFLVSGRRYPVRSAALMRSRIEAGHLVGGPVALFELMIDQFLRATSDALRGLRTEADSIEDSVLDDRVRDESRRLAPLRRTAVQLRRQLAGFRGILRGFAEDQEERATHSGSRAAAERLLHRIEALEQEVLEVQDRARFLQDEIGAKLANTTNRHLYVLSVLTALLMPATLVTGIFGMNTGGLPLEQGTNGSVLALLLACLASALVYLLLRKLGFFD
ncbi:magnesium transporter CorA [Kaistia dalseonensis]|uniref:Mg2+ and Co2+ transporter CorA n=1 Tax=Kaistia dalseonensis TaxID=410840 RepID=A0ABU0H108_9HYPH|nr:CorA family divalent cation transporter [Kaistia dalseonensis]MCX5493434.1 magnesium transporter CorA [Kaistia dalseonensis]MDQ0435993.1 Mg2+ and Co2+ transporter CorA [Kaistia dalseonensis]